MRSKKREYLGHVFVGKNMPVRTGKLKIKKGPKPLKPWAFPQKNPLIPSR